MSDWLKSSRLEKSASQATNSFTTTTWCQSAKAHHFSHLSQSTHLLGKYSTQLATHTEIFSFLSRYSLQTAWHEIQCFSTRETPNCCARWSFLACSTHRLENQPRQLQTSGTWLADRAFMPVSSQQVRPVAAMAAVQALLALSGVGPQARGVRWAAAAQPDT